MKKRPKYDELHETLIWKIQTEALRIEYSDIAYIKKHTRFNQIEKEISYYIDLTQEEVKHHIEEIEDNFDEEQLENESNKELLVFTDGSVQKNIGGYGYHMIRGKEYRQLRGQSKKKYIDNASKNNWHENWMWLSRRCSIDFCEMNAIQDAIRDIAINLREGKKQEIDSIRIISDSQTSIKWLMGEYIIKNAAIKRICEAIRYDANTITEETGAKIRIQWVKAHEDTNGNERADHLANLGRIATKKDKGYERYENWKFISKKAICNEIKRLYRKQTKAKHNDSMSKTKFGELLQDVKWTKRFKAETKILTRRELRILMGLRNGHNYLRKYLKERLHKKIDIKCRCGKGEETVKHIWEECEDERTKQEREKTQKILRNIIKEDNRALNESQNENEWWKSEKVRWRKAKDVLYVNAKRCSATKAKYLKTIIYFFKQYEMQNIKQLYKKGIG